MKLTFITGNKDKFNQAKIILADSGIELESHNLDLPEIQSLDGDEVIKYKAEALSSSDIYKYGPCIVEDTSLYINAINGFPGPLAKYLYISVGAFGLVDIAKKFNDDICHAITRIAFIKDNLSNPKYFSGRINGRLRESSVYLGHGFEDVFVPDGQTSTLSEMPPEVRPLVNMRGIAFNQLISYLFKEGLVK